MATLSGLPNTKSDVEAVMVSTKATALLHVANDTPITVAGEFGAINIWLDDNRDWRCEFLHRLFTVDSCHAITKRGVKRWLDIWWRRMQHGLEA